MTALYPAFLRLEGRRCIVVGGGRVAERKVASLLEAGARVTVVAPRTTARIAELSLGGTVEVRSRKYRPDDLEGAWLAFAATDQPLVNRRVVEDAQRRNVPVNAADEPERGDFQVPATVRRGDVVVAVSTNGRSPGYARYLRAELEEWLTPERVDLFELVSEVRRELQMAGRNPPASVWREAIGAEVLERLTAGDRTAARERLVGALAIERVEV